MMGDNRDNSTDSRDESSVGYVPFENLVGRAEIIFFSIDENAQRLEGLGVALDGALEPHVSPADPLNAVRMRPQARHRRARGPDRLPLHGSRPPRRAP